MEIKETTRWYLKRQHYLGEFCIVNLGVNTDISRSERSVIPLDRASFNHISKRHCTISCKDEVATLTDETSSTGTFVNERKFSREHPGSIILSEGDLIGIGTQCYLDKQFYNKHNVLLFRVCKDRNRIVREGEVYHISDDEPEVKQEVEEVPDSDDEPQKTVPQLVPKEEIKLEKVARDASQYKIYMHIDLSSEEEDTGAARKASKAPSVQQDANAVTEVKPPQKTEELKRHKDKDRDRHRHHGHSRKKSSDRKEDAKSSAQDEKLAPIEEKSPDPIEDLSRHSRLQKSPERPQVPTVTIDVSDDEDFSEQKLTQSFYRQIKQEALEADLADEEPEEVDELAEIRKAVKQEIDSPCKARQLIDDSPVYISDDDEDDQLLEDSKRWFTRLSQRISPLRNKSSCSGDGSVTRPLITALPSEKPIELDEYCSRDVELTDDLCELDFEDETSDTTGGQQEATVAAPPAENISTTSDESRQPVASNNNTASDRQERLGHVSPPLSNSSKKSDAPRLPETTIKHVTNNHQEGSSVVSAPRVNGFARPDEPRRTETPNKNAANSRQEGPVVSAPRQNDFERFDEPRMTEIDPLARADPSGYFDRMFVELDSLQEPETSQKKHPQDDSFVSPEAKKQKVDQPSKTPSTVGSPRVIAESVGLKPSSDGSRGSSFEKNTNSASYAWISKKPTLVEPHHIVKRRMSSGAPLVSKKPKIAKSAHPPSPVRKPEHTKEVRKQKLKEISTKKAEANGDSRNGKPVTKPKVKFTPSNRGAFLTEAISGPSKPPKPRESVPVSNGFDDFICTQSTTLDNMPTVDDILDNIPIRAPKLTFDSVAKVSNVTRGAPQFKIPKRVPAPPPSKQTSTTPTITSPANINDNPLQSILDSIKTSAPPAFPKLPHPPKQPKKIQQSLSDAVIPWDDPVPSTSNGLHSNRTKSILKSPCGAVSRTDRPKKTVIWKKNLVETRTYEIDEGNHMLTETKYNKDNKQFFCDVSQESCQNEIIQEITGWSADWLDNPAEWAITGSTGGGQLLPMVEEYADFDDYKRIVMPILKTELFHDIVEQYEEASKRGQKPIQMKINEIRPQGKTFTLNCSVESSNHQSINNKDYVLIIFNDRNDGKECRFLAVVTNRRQQIQYTTENGTKFFQCTIETAKTLMAKKVRDGENYRILSLTNITHHMRQMHVLFNLKNSPLLDNILSPKSNFYTSSEDIDHRSFKGKESLNRQQGDILLTVFGRCLDMSQPHITLIQGPPGTGKSRLISNLVLQLHRGIPNRQMKILVCAQSNTAVDVIMLKLIRFASILHADEKLNVLRTGAANKVHPECRMFFLDDLVKKDVNKEILFSKLRKEDPLYETYYLQRETLQKKIKQLRNQARHAAIDHQLEQLQTELETVKRLLPEDVDSIDLHDKDRRNREKKHKTSYISNADVICTTLGSCGALMDQAPSLKFDICIIDEATQCTEIASFLPLQFDVRQLILVGDVKQLPPLVLSKDCANAGLRRSLFSRIESSFIGTQLKGVKMLTEQYRMHPEILKWPNEHFYGGKLSSNPEATRCDAFPFKPYTIFSLECQQNLTQTAHDIYNNEEIAFVLSLLTEIMKYCDRYTSIAIITPYTRQKRECEKFLHEKRITQVSVLSIDSVQGQEYDVVIISLARTKGAGFLDNPQRLNVALTRARKCLIMCGNFADLRDIKVWSALLKDAESRKLLFHIEDDDEYDDVNSFVEKVMRHLRKPPPSNDAIAVKA